MQNPLVLLFFFLRLIYFVGGKAEREGENLKQTLRSAELAELQAVGPYNPRS